MDEYVMLMRVTAHLMAFGLFTAIAIVAVVAHGAPISMRHWRLIVATCTLYALWCLGLIVSAGTAPTVPRKELVPVLGTLEFAAGVVGWCWLVLTLKASFRVTSLLRRDVREGVL